MKKAISFILIICCLFLMSCENSPNKKSGNIELDISNKNGTKLTTEEESTQDDGTKPSMRLMLEDVSQIPEFCNTTNDQWNVVDAVETLARTVDKSYETTLRVQLSNETYEQAFRTIKLFYDYYEIGGWVLNTYSDITRISGAVPKDGIPEAVAFNDVGQYYYGVIELRSHETNLEAKTDILTYDREYKGNMLTQQSIIVVTYNTSEDTGLWYPIKIVEKDRKCQLNPQSKWKIEYRKSKEPLSSSHSFVHCIQLAEMNENTVKLHVIDYETIHWVSTGIYGQGYYNDDYEAHFTGKALPEDYVMHTARGEDDTLYYSFYTLTGTVEYNENCDGYFLHISNDDFAENSIIIKPDGIYSYGQHGISESPVDLKYFSDQISKLSEIERELLSHISFE